ncbi:jg2130 [Pararge aegeria aegeria]|uniref:nitric-oxide synthase (NADPH) n=1 Tax=Pararge aegeria aegeria TaxID=348720 RepID=A0A8S4RRP8_9NEOP|nr:jg2130 [Pararge aegeria aegeria]
MRSGTMSRKNRLGVRVTILDCIITYQKPTLCNEKSCLGSLMAIPGRGDVPRNPEEVLSDAKDFLGQYFASIRRANTVAHEARWKTVQEEVVKTGTYQLTTTELVFGAKLAWRNASRCIGRIQWSKLQVSSNKTM